MIEKDKYQLGNFCVWFDNRDVSEAILDCFDTVNFWDDKESTRLVFTFWEIPINYEQLKKALSLIKRHFTKQNTKIKNIEILENEVKIIF